MKVKFIKNCSPYVVDDIAGVPDKLGEKLIKKEYAIEIFPDETPAEENIPLKAGDSEEIEQVEPAVEQAEKDVAPTNEQPKSRGRKNKE